MRRLQDFGALSPAEERLRDEIGLDDNPDGFVVIGEERPSEAAGPERQRYLALMAARAIDIARRELAADDSASRAGLEALHRGEALDQLVHRDGQRLGEVEEAQPPPVVGEEQGDGRCAIRSRGRRVGESACRAYSRRHQEDGGIWMIVANGSDGIESA